jgi:UDP-arabinose 4-epimerase
MVETVLVAGGAGYIGSHTCKALARAGLRPVVYDDLSHGHSWAVRWGPLEVGDLTDGERLDACLRRYRPMAVIHLAAFIAAGESVTDPAKYYDNNLQGTLTLLDTMRRHRISRMVFSSSAAVYGAPESTPIQEDAIIRPVNPYGHTKAMCEQILTDYAAAYGVRSVSLRYFNAAGADPDGELGEAHDPETHLIPLVLETAAGFRTQIDIFGDQHPTRDGTCIRDYIHVTDLAAAHVLALRKLDGSTAVSIYNLGNGQGFSVFDVVHAAERVTNRRIPIRVCPPRPGDPPVLLADSRRATAGLGWRPTFGELETQLTHAWQWLCRRKRPRQARPSVQAHVVATK